LKKIIFIGGSGFIGKSFIDAFSRGLLKKFKIKKLVVISRNIQEIKKTKINLKNIRLIKGDISKLKKIPKSDYVIYGAEYADLKNKKNYLEEIYQSKKSIDNFCNIIKSQKKTKVLYLSSGAVYRFKKLHNLTRDVFIDKKKAYVFIKNYSEKKIIELKKYEIKTSIARCFTFIGAWIPRKSKYAIGNFVDNVVLNQSIKVKSTLKVIRSYMYADDMVKWLITICKHSKINTKVYDVGSDKPIEIRSLANLFSKLFKNKIKFKKKTSSKVDKYLPNIKDTKKNLGLSINYNLKESIIKTINRIYEQTY